MNDQASDRRLVRNFFRAVGSLDLRAVKGFLDQGMPLNTVDPRTGATILHYAAAYRARPLFRMVNEIDRALRTVNGDGIDYLTRDKQGRLASELAGVYGHDPAMARLLLMKETIQARERGLPPPRRRERPALSR